MFFLFEALGTGVGIVVVIFVILFIFLVVRWALKRTKEISKEFEMEAKELSLRRTDYEDLVERVDLLKKQLKKAADKGDAKTAKELSQEISRLEKERIKAYKKIKEY